MASPFDLLEVAAIEDKFSQLLQVSERSIPQGRVWWSDVRVPIAAEKVSPAHLFITRLSGHLKVDVGAERAHRAVDQDPRKDDSLGDQGKQFISNTAKNSHSDHSSNLHQHQGHNNHSNHTSNFHQHQGHNNHSNHMSNLHQQEGHVSHSDHRSNLHQQQGHNLHSDHTE